MHVIPPSASDLSFINTITHIHTHTYTQGKAQMYVQTCIHANVPHKKRTRARYKCITKTYAVIHERDVMDQMHNLHACKSTHREHPQNAPQNPGGMYIYPQKHWCTQATANTHTHKERKKVIVSVCVPIIHLTP